MCTPAFQCQVDGKIPSYLSQLLEPTFSWVISGGGADSGMIKSAAAGWFTPARVFHVRNKTLQNFQDDYTEVR